LISKPQATIDWRCQQQNFCRSALTTCFAVVTRCFTPHERFTLLRDPAQPAIMRPAPRHSRRSSLSGPYKRVSKAGQEILRRAKNQRSNGTKFASTVRTAQQTRRAPAAALNKTRRPSSTSRPRSRRQSVEQQPDSNRGTSSGQEEVDNTAVLEAIVKWGEHQRPSTPKWKLKKQGESSTASSREPPQEVKDACENPRFRAGLNYEALRILRKPFEVGANLSGLAVVE